MNTPLAHLPTLKSQLVEEIEQKGPLSFCTFMERALYDPTWGYYMSHVNPFGPSGDFITGPELTPLFAESLIPSFLKMVQNGIEPVIVELGGGSGGLAYHFIQALQKRNIPWTAYHLVEISPSLQQKQAQKLGTLSDLPRDRIHWHTELDFPVEGFIIANEFLDAFPVHLIHYHNGTFYEWKVDAQQGELLWVPALMSDPALIQEVDRLKPWAQEWPDNYRTEIHLRAHQWLQQQMRFVKKGFALFIDYGYPERVYYHPDRTTGTLRAHIQHHAHEDVLAGPGLQDLTTFINFTAVASLLNAQQWATSFYASQAEFLLSQGILDQVDPNNLQQTHAIKMLTLEMGETFQVLGMSKGTPELCFPEIRDRSPRLGL